MGKLIFLANDSIEFSKTLDCLENSFFNADDIYINASAYEYFFIFDVEDSHDANWLEQELTALFGANNINGFFELN